MTRALLLLTMLSSIAFGQTYVRPSKGASFSPFTDTGLDGGWFVSGTSGGYYAYFTKTGNISDWSAFEAVRVRIYGTDQTLPDGGVPARPTGTLCSAMSYQYTVSDLGGYIRFRLSDTGRSGWYLQVLDGPTSAGPFVMTTSSNNSVQLSALSDPTRLTYSDFQECYIRVQVTPIPFAPPTSGATTAVSLPDGGITVNVSSASKPTCTAVKGWAYGDAGTTVFNVPLDGGLSSRWFIRACNKANNSGTPTMTCTEDGQVPTTAAGSVGDALGVGDCATYYTTNTIQCIVDTAGTAISTEECQ